MTKLEQKLQELGYEKGAEYKSNQYWFIYVKHHYYPLVITYDSQVNTIYGQGVCTQNTYIYSKVQLIALEKSLKEYEKDLEELEKCQN